MDLSLDEIIERKRGYGGRSANKKFNPSYTKHRKLLNRTPFQAVHSFDARNKIIQKTRAQIGDARDIINWKIRDARQLLQDRKKNRLPLALFGEIIDEEPLSDRMPCLGRNDSRARGVQFGRRTLMERSASWEEEDDDSVGLRGHNRSYTSGLIHSAKPFPPHGYVDHDNMQVVEDGEISSSLRFGNNTNQPHSSHRMAHLPSSRTVTTNSSGVEVDIDAVYSALFLDYQAIFIP